MTLEEKLFELIKNHEEDGALKLLHENYNSIDLNKEVNMRVPIFSAINEKMYKLAIAIVSHPHFNPDIEDGFGESFLQSLIYLYCCDDISDEDKAFCEKIIRAMLDAARFDVNYKDLNDETALSICAEFPKTLWIIEKLLKFPKIDVNIVSDFQTDALGNAIRHKNIEAAKLIYASGKVKISDMHKKLAEGYEVDLNEIVPHVAYATVSSL